MLLVLILSCSVAVACGHNISERQPVFAFRHCLDDCQRPDSRATMPYVMTLKIAEHNLCIHEHLCPVAAEGMRGTPCTNGYAGEYECLNVDLLSFVPVAELGCGGDTNDIWGWTDPETGHEYAMIGCVDGTSFVDITDPVDPQMLGFLRTKTGSSIWRDLKVFKNHVFIVSEASNHGMQVYDLTQLRGLKQTSHVRELEETAFYGEFGSAHNIVANEDTGFMYSVGSKTCTSGLHMVDVNDPTNPQFVGCYGEDGYVHDAQCVIYNGPDDRYRSREICFCYNEDTLTIVDVDDKANPRMIARESYDAYYTHQGWLTEDQSHLLLNDELDELYSPSPYTRSLIWNVEDLKKPYLVNIFYSKKEATDHNLYIKGNIAYESNYCAGLRVLDVMNMKEGKIEEIGYFDVDPNCDEPGFHGAWSSYPYFESGSIIVSSLEHGLFVLKFNA